MIIHSFVQSDLGFRPIQVEIVLMPGVSQIQILGLPDQVIKESSKRILSALRHQGFRMPPGKQVLVNLHPAGLKKRSHGLDLAIALGILLESEQISKDFFNFQEDYCYGSLSLKGEVLVPDDLKLLNYSEFSKNLLTGPSEESWRFATYQLEELKATEDINIHAGCEDLFKCEDFKINEDLFFEQTLAELMTLTAVGEHPLLIAGFAGCGKTTMVENLATLLEPPEEKTFLQAKKYWMLSGRDLRQRPVVQPHHSATPIAMIGGGQNLKVGEISLAHGGALILDELLEFHPLVQSALREPMEKGKIYLSRAGMRKIFPAQALVLATTNLCPCGNFEPGASFRCRCSSLRLRNYIERLTGPFLDRFTLFHLYQKPKLNIKQSLKEIKKRVHRATEFRQQSRAQSYPNQFLRVRDLKTQLDQRVDEKMIPQTRSHRRSQALLRVARTLADMEASEKIKQAHLEQAMAWTASDIYKLERFRMEDFAAR